MNTKRKLRYFYHDMANHLQVASRMSPEDGNAYLEEMIQKSGIKLKNIKHTDQTEAFGELMKCLDRLQDQKVGSEKPPDRRELAVQYLIESKKQECVRNKIETEFLIQLPANRSVLCSEWVSLLGNLLDNAIEACRYAEGERKIRLITEDGGGFWLLTMENAIGNKKKKRGCGIKIIRKLVRKSRGRFKMDKTDKIMISKVWLPVLRRKTEV